MAVYVEHDFKMFPIMFFNVSYILMRFYSLILKIRSLQSSSTNLNVCNVPFSVVQENILRICIA